MIDDNTAKSDRQWMSRALKLAEQAALDGEVPVGALIVRDDVCIGEGYNQPIGAHDPTSHAEIMALRDAASRVGNYRLPGATLYVTLEPCTMCFGAMMHARITRLVYGATEPRAGVCESQLKLPQATFFNHRMAVTGGVMAEPSAALLKQFFKARR